MDVRASGLVSIQTGMDNLRKTAEKISRGDTESLADDAVTISLSKVQVRAGAALIKSDEELSQTALSLLDEER